MSICFFCGRSNDQSLLIRDRDAWGRRVWACQDGGDCATWYRRVKALTKALAAVPPDQFMQSAGYPELPGMGEAS